MDKQYQDLSLVAGANLKRLIKESEYKTQDKFAYAFGTELRNVSRWCNNGINQIDTIQQIAEFFDVDIFTILK